jgi:tetratricopeptide (TPR) repeat protein
VNPDRRIRWQTAAACVFLAVATLGAYWPVFHCGYLNFDDPDYVTENLAIRRGLTSNAMAWAFSTGHAANWHPLTWLSHAADCQLFGLNPVGHHATNLLFHIANSLLVLLLLKKMTGALWRSAFVAALFALHPLHVESVAWISERKDVLSTFFGLLALWAYAAYAGQSQVQSPKSKVQGPESVVRDPWSVVCGPSSIFYLLSLALFSCSLMSKPMLVTLPFLLLLLDYWPLRRWPVASGEWRVAGRNPDVQRSMFNVRCSSFARLLFEKLPFLLLSAASSFATYLVQKHAGAISDGSVAPFSSRLGNAIVGWMRYLGKAAWPRDLAIAYPPVHWPLWQVIGSALVLILISMLFLRSRRPYLVTGWFWFLGALVPVIGLVQIGFQSMADRYSYVPLIGLFLILAWGCWDLVQRLPAPCRRVFISLSLGLLLALAWLTSVQTCYWQDSNRLFARALAVNPDNALAHTKLAEVFLDQRQLTSARAHLIPALQLAPRFPEAHYQFGRLLLAENQPEEGIAQWRTALQLRPGWLPLMNNLAWTLATCRDPACRNPAEAVRLAEQASAADQRNFSFFDTLGAAYAAAGRFPDAAAAARQAVALAEAADQTDAAARFRLRLDLYRSNQPYHE